MPEGRLEGRAGPGAAGADPFVDGRNATASLATRKVLVFVSEGWSPQRPEISRVHPAFLAEEQRLRLERGHLPGEPGRPRGGGRRHRLHGLRREPATGLDGAVVGIAPFRGAGSPTSNRGVAGRSIPTTGARWRGSSKRPGTITCSLSSAIRPIRSSACFDELRVDVRRRGLTVRA